METTQVMNPGTQLAIGFYNNGA